MFPSAEYVLAGELADRRERIANDFARVGRVRRAPRRRGRAHLAENVHSTVRRLRSRVAAAH